MAKFAHDRPQAQEGRHPHGRQERLLRRASPTSSRSKFTRAGRQDRRASETYTRGRHRLPRAAHRDQAARARTASTCPATTPTSGLIARQARELGIKVPLMGGDGWDSREALRDRRRGDRRAATSRTTTRPTIRRPRVQKFIAEYKAAYGARARRAGGARLRRGAGSRGRDDARGIGRRDEDPRRARGDELRRHGMTTTARIERRQAGDHPGRERQRR